jgi:hypothetical protein
MARWIALLVGVDKYKDLGELKGAVNDAESLWESLIDPPIGLFDKDASRKILNPTKSQLDQELATFFDEVKAGDILLVYVAGHGAALQNKLYLATTDTRLMNTAYFNPATAIPFGVIEDLLRYSPATSVMTVIDACESAVLAEEITGLRSALRSAGANVFRSLGQGYQYLSACRPHQSAQETTVDNTNHGQLTAAVVHALHSGSNVPASEEFLTFTALCRFVQDFMAGLDDQQPVQFNSDLASPIRIARNINYRPPQSWQVSFTNDFVDILKRFELAGEGLHRAREILETVQWTVWRKLEHWKVIESPRQGYGKITELGIEFLAGRVELPKTLEIRDNRVVTESTEIVGINDFS